MKFILFFRLFLFFLVFNQAASLINPTNSKPKLSKNLQNGPIYSPSSTHNSNPLSLYPDYRFSQTKLQETNFLNEKNKIAIESVMSNEQAGGGDKPVFTLNIHAPQESTEDIIG